MQQNEILVAPSILAGDFGYLADEAKRVEEAGADCLHIDIMDGHFVPNLTLGPKAVAALNRATSLFLDVHIMIYNPFDFVERLVEAGADRIIFHFEATEEIDATLEYIHKCNVEAGLALRPETSGEFVIPYLSKCDLVLLMTVPPGFGGQQFHYEVVEKIRFVREMCKKLKVVPKSNKKGMFPIEVDGGIDEKTAPLCIEAGANVLVSGTYLFEQEEMGEGIRKLRGEI